jgi:hypothetical protein
MPFRGTAHPSYPSFLIGSALRVATRFGEVRVDAFGRDAQCTATTLDNLVLLWPASVRRHWSHGGSGRSRPDVPPRDQLRCLNCTLGCAMRLIPERLGGFDRHDQLRSVCSDC